MKNISLLFLVIILAGCASAMPNFYNGKYYMAGDSNCVRARQYTEDKIMCINSNGDETGWRAAMTDQQLQMYQHNQQRQQQQYKTKNTNCYRTYGGGMNCATY
ncbi:MAG: hypothetical protein RQ936_02270 [Gammaproteobacteria bacterium]|nr:hypothetical protein [Gammaproteobacteria bacterium]